MLPKREACLFSKMGVNFSRGFGTCKRNIDYGGGLGVVCTRMTMEMGVYLSRAGIIVIVIIVIIIILILIIIVVVIINIIIIIIIIINLIWETQFDPSNTKQFSAHKEHT